MFLTLDGRGERYRQLVRALKQAIADGRLATGTRLPASRELALELKLSRNTVVAAYELLCAEQWATTRRGSGTFVTAAPTALVPSPVETHIAAPSRYAARLRELPALPLPRPRPELRINLQYGEPLTNLALFSSWQQSLSHAASKSSAGYPPSQGVPALRAEIARHLGRWRGVRCDPDDILVVHGTQQALSIVARVLLDEGDRVAVEDPGYALASHCFIAHGAQLMPVPVDRDGLVVERLPDTALKLIVVTPSHQFPLGVVLSLQRREALLAQATQAGAWVIEDDYDGEFGFEGRRLPALKSLDADGRVIYVGTFSKSLLPSVRLGYLVCPRPLRRDFVTAKRLADIGCSGIDQHALAHWMANGAYERHLRRSSLELRRRRKALLQGLEEHGATRLVVQDAGTGMHMLCWLPDLDETGLQTLIDLAAAHGLGLHALNPHCTSPIAMPALLLGFAGTSVAQIRLATRWLSECLAAVEPQSSGVRRVFGGGTTGERKDECSSSDMS